MAARQHSLRWLARLTALWYKHPDMSSNLLTRIDRLLADPKSVVEKVEKSAPSAAEQPVHRRIRDAISGALREKVVVKPGVAGGITAAVPVAALVANGIRIAENAVPGQPAVLSGTIHAVANAERRIAKMCGEGYGARLEGFDPERRVAIFQVICA